MRIETHPGPRARPLRPAWAAFTRTGLLVAAAFLASAVLPQVAGAECVNSVLAGDGPEVATCYSMDSVTASGDDLWITLEGPEDTAAKIQLVDSEGIIAATGDVFF